jgi:hypothetical protein
MDDREFEKMDRSFMKATKDLRERPAGVSYGVAAEVEKRLRAGAAPERRAPRVLPWLVPAVALSLIVAVVPALRAPAPVPAPASPARIQLASNPSSALDEDIAVLKAVGAWTDDDDHQVAPEVEYEEVELTQAARATALA